MKTRKSLTEAEAIAIIEDEATEWRLVSHRQEADDIRRHVLLRDQAIAELDETVITARQHGLTWLEIGDALGVSHQAARKK